VIAGAGSNSTGQAMELSTDAEAAGADAVLSVVPYYNKPTHVRAFSRDRRIDRLADHPSRRPRAHRMWLGGRYHRAAGGTSAIHRSQGRYRRCRAATASAVTGGVGLSIAVGR
jgi:Dihydrodipicolinate synthetase family